MYDKFKKLMAERGVKASDVCKATGINKSVISRWKSGQFTPKYDKVQKIADYFGVDTSYFYLDEAIEEHNKSVDAMLDDIADSIFMASMRQFDDYKFSDKQMDKINSYIRFVMEDDNGNEHND